MSKVLSLFLCFVMVFSFTVTQAFAQDAETISVDGYVFQVIEKDIKGGNNFGIDTCWFNNKKEECVEYIPTYEIHDLIELKKIL